MVTNSKFICSHLRLGFMCEAKWSALAIPNTQLMASTFPRLGDGSWIQTVHGFVLSSVFVRCVTITIGKTSSCNYRLKMDKKDSSYSPMWHHQSAMTIINMMPEDIAQPSKAKDSPAWKTNQAQLSCAHQMLIWFIHGIHFLCVFRWFLGEKELQTVEGNPQVDYLRSQIMIALGKRLWDKAGKIQITIALVVSEWSFVWWPGEGPCWQTACKNLITDSGGSWSISKWKPECHWCCETETY